MKIKNTLLQLLLIGATLTQSCVEEVPFKREKADSYLAVEGNLTNQNAQQVLKLSRSEAYGTTPSPVPQARVTVFSGDGSSAQYREIAPGYYELDSNAIRRTVGQTYFVEIKLPTGETYRSKPEKMPSPLPIDSISWDVTRYTRINALGNPASYNVLNAYVSAPAQLNGQNMNLRWRVESAFQFTTLPQCNFFGNTFKCFFNKETNPQNIIVASAEASKITRIDRLRVAFDPIEPQYRFYEIYLFRTFQYSISPEAYTYWKRLNAVSNPNGSIFDPVPAAVAGNLYNVNNPNELVLGYFEVSSLTVNRTFIRRSDMVGRIPLLEKERLCGFLFGQFDQYFEGCCNCLMIPEAGATLERPVDWL